MVDRWGNNGNSDRLYFWGLQVTSYGDCSHEMKRHLLLRRKVMTNLGSILKSRDITLPTKVHLVKAMLFPVVMPLQPNLNTFLLALDRLKDIQFFKYTAAAAAAAAKSHQSCPTLCDPIDGSPPGSRNTLVNQKISETQLNLKCYHRKLKHQVACTWWEWENEMEKLHGKKKEKTNL